MKKLIRGVITVSIAVSVCLSIFSSVSASAASAFVYDGFGEYGQRSIDVYSKITESNVVIDGVISDGEYLNEPIVLEELSNSFYWSDWSKNGISAEDMKDILPSKVTYYVEYDEDGLCIAAEIVEPTPYSSCDQPMDLWGLDSLEIDVAIDAGNLISKNTFTQQNMHDRIRTTYALADVEKGKPTPMGFCYTPSFYGRYTEGQKMESFDIKRNEETSTTTYEIFYAWDDLWSDGIPTEVFINFQLHIADEAFLDQVADGYVACIGGLRFACKLPDAAKTEYGLSSSTIFHVFKLVGQPEEEGEVNDGDAVTDTPEDTDGSNVSNSTKEESNNEAETENSVSSEESSGCGSMLTPMATVAVLSVCSGAVLLRKKENG